jgi:NADH-quinone oxidoreductase subunit A
MADSLLPVVLLIGMSTAVAASLIIISALADVARTRTRLLGRPRRSVVDRTPYECGAVPYERVETHRFSIHFYLVAMLFILFDIEAAFLIPWAVTFRDFAANKMFVLGEMGVFLGILVVGFVYLWNRGALDWD